jgi:hypothetical protein
MTISQTRVRDVPRGRIGQVYGISDNYIEQNFDNATGAAADTTEIVVDTATAKTYSLTIDGDTLDVDVTGSPSKTDVAEEIESAIQNTPRIFGLVDTSVSGDTLTLTARVQRVDVPVSTSDADLTVTETVADAAEGRVSFGRVVYRAGDRGVDLSNPMSTFDGTFTVDTVENDTEYAITFELYGELYEVSIVSAGSATEDGIVQALETEADNLGLDLIDGTSDTGANPSEFHLEATLGGTQVKVRDWSDELAYEEATSADDPAIKVAGITRHTYDSESDDPYEGSPGSYAPGSEVNVLRRGKIYVEFGDNASYGDRVYVASDGKPYASQDAGGNRLPLPKSVAQWDDANIVQITLGY